MSISTESPRIPPLIPKDFTEEQKAIVGDWHILNLSRVLARHPKLYKAYVPFIEKVISFTDIPPWDREIICIRLLHRCQEVYELNHHETIARTKVNMTDEQILAVKTNGSGLSDFDKLLIKATDQLKDNKLISDETWQALAERYSEVELMELIGLAGCYITLVMMTKNFEIQIEEEQSTDDQLQELRQYN